MVQSVPMARSVPGTICTTICAILYKMVAELTLS